MKIIFIYSMATEGGCQCGIMGESVESAQAVLSFHGVAFFDPCGVAGEKGHNVRVAGVPGHDRGLETRGSTVPPAVKDDRRVLFRGKERSHPVEFLLGNMNCAWYAARCIFEGCPVVHKEEPLVLLHQSLQVFHVDVPSTVGKETASRKSA